MLNLKIFLDRKNTENRIILLISVVFMLSVLLVAHTLGIEGKLYYIYNWYDFFTHWLGGGCVGLCVYAFHKTHIYIIPILSVWVSSVIWELFEFYVVLVPWHFIDAFSDAVWATLGAVMFITIAKFLYKFK